MSPVCSFLSLTAARPGVSRFRLLVRGSASFLSLAAVRGRFFLSRAASFLSFVAASSRSRSRFSTREWGLPQRADNTPPTAVGGSILQTEPRHRHRAPPLSPPRHRARPLPSVPSRWPSPSVPRHCAFAHRAHPRHRAHCRSPLPSARRTMPMCGRSGANSCASSCRVDTRCEAVPNSHSVVPFSH